MNIKKPGPRLIVALDVDLLEEARRLIDILSPVVDIFKVGSQLFTSCGPVAVRFLQARGKKVFLDLKFHDIPNTVANAVHNAVNLSAAINVDRRDKDNKLIGGRPSLFMYTLHVSGGEEMLRRAIAAGRQQAEAIKVTPPLALGITVLTSEIKTDNIQNLVLERARSAQKAGLDGIVASCEEAPMLRREMGPDFLIVTPGIRPAGSQEDDQKRVATPARARESGSDYIVVGRPVVQAGDPLKAAKGILSELTH